MQPPLIPPIQVTLIAPERPWYTQWDFWVSVGTLIVAAMTGWYAYETRKLRKGSDKAMAELGKHAENSAAASKASADAAARQAIEAEKTRLAQADALVTQAQGTERALALAERNATAAEDNAKTASQSITLAKQSMQLTLRAYVTIDKILPVNQNPQKIPREVSITVINTGQTPARVRSKNSTSMI